MVDGPARAADDRDLRESLDGLSRLVLGQDQQGLADLLRQVADLAVHAVPGADAAGLTLSGPDQPDLVVSSTGSMVSLDPVQYSLGEGPGLEAVRTRRTVVSGMLAADPRWASWKDHAAELDVRSVLSLPLLSVDTELGVLNLYSCRAEAFDRRAVELAELFAVPAAISVQNAQRLAQAQRLVMNLQQALTSRAVIDQAVGILMSRHGCSVEDAVSRLKTMSQAGTGG